MAATRFIALHVNRDKDASARGADGSSARRYQTEDWAFPQRAKFQFYALAFDR